MSFLIAENVIFYGFAEEKNRQFFAKWKENPDWKLEIPVQSDLVGSSDSNPWVNYEYHDRVIFERIIHFVVHALEMEWSLQLVMSYTGHEDYDTAKWELVGTHTGRRTFIVNALSLGITLNNVMKWTGHFDYKAMKPYIDTVDSIKASSMTKFDGLI